MTEYDYFAKYCYKSLLKFWNIFELCVIYINVEGGNFNMANTGVVLEIGKENYTEADFMSKRFVNAEVRNRAYINVLGSELFIKFLEENGIKTEDVISMHSISKIIENIDIADVILPNIHIDVRTIFDDDKIFVPKSHFELEITPDIYVVLKMSKNMKDAEILGYFKPSQINKNYANEDYYFVKKETLVPAKMLLDKISQYAETRDSKLTNAEFLRGRALSVDYSDHNLDLEGQKEFLKLMLTDSMLRDSVAEFDNFEVLSSQVSSVLLERIEIKKQNEAKAVPGIAALTTEEILKEGVKAVVEEQKAKVEEVFEQAKDVAVASTEVLGAVAQVVDAAEKSAEGEKKLPELEILNTDEIEQEAENVVEDLSEGADLNIEEPEQAQEEVSEIVEEEDAPTISDIDTLKEEDVTAEAEVQAQTEDETPEIVEDTLSQISDDDLTLGDIDEDLSLDIDVQPIDEVEKIEEAQEVEPAQEENATEEDLIVEDNQDEVEITEEKEPEIVENTESETAEEDLNLNDIDNELTLDEDFQIPEVEDLSITDEETSPKAENLDDLTIVEEETSEIVEPENAEISAVEEVQPAEENVTSNEEIATTDEENLVVEDTLAEPELSIDEDFGELVEEPLSGEESFNIVEENVKPADLTADEVLDNAIAAIDTAKNVEIDASKAVSDSAIKMASVAGGAIDNLVEDNVIKQSENLSHKDIANLGQGSAINNNDEHASFVGGLSDAKRQANMLAEAQGLATVTDISTLETVEQQKQEDIVHNVVDMENMETVEREEHVIETPEMVELDKFSGVDSPTKPVEGLENMDLQINDAETMELPDLNSYTINEDGTSPLDNMNWGTEDEAAKGDLLDLEAADLLIGEENNKPQVENTENLVDGEDFKPQSANFDLDETTEQVEDFQELGENDFEITEDLNFDASEGLENLDSVSETNDEPAESANQGVELNVDSANNDDVAVQAQNADESVQEVDFSQDTNLDDFFGDSEVSEVQEEVTAPKDETKNDEIDWTQDTGFDALQDVEINPETATTAPQEGEEVTISEAPREFKVQENSTVISSENFTPGEINIDINTRNILPVNPENQPINELFQEESPVDNGSMMKNPGRLTKPSQQPPKGIALGLGLAGLVVVLGLIFALGFGVSKFLKGQTEETPQPISDNSGDLNMPEPAQTQPEQPQGQVVEMNNNTNALASTAGTKPTKKSDFVEVKKLSWEVPGAVSAEPKFQEYFQSAGKSIKSALMTDLLSVTDLAYASEMRVSVSFEQDGTFKDARIVTSSGSSQLDNIVLRTVNQTLNVLKAPRSVGSYENTTAVLKIYL